MLLPDFVTGKYIRLQDINNLMNTNYSKEDIEHLLPNYAIYSSFIEIDSPCIACSDCNCNLEGWYGIQVLY